jgi:hypothetical protein
VTRMTRREVRVDERQQRRMWQMCVTRGGCVMCRAYPLTREQRAGREPELRRVEAHHITAKRHLKNHGLNSHMWDPRNGMGLCVYHHHRHEHWMQRVPYELVPDDAVEFADELGLLALLEHDYPERGEHGNS